MTHPTERIRNVVLVGHGGAGKTTLAESLLARAGAVTRAGAVDDGTSLLDHEPESVKRRISLTMALAPFDWTARDGQTYRINLMDTPGYVDFEGQVDTALGVADLAVFVVSAVDGVEVRTERLWRRCAALGIPRMVFVNKEDRERADFHGVFDQLTAAFGGGFVALEEPDGEAAALSGVTDLLTEEGHRLHGAVVEEIVSGDDEQLERYLGGEAPSTADLERTLAHEVLDGLEFPVLLGSATTGVGIDRLADYICEIGPSPADRPATIIAGDARSSVMADATAPTLLHVFATVSDPYVGQLSLFKVLSGTVRTDDRLVNSTTGTEERLHALFTVRGKEQQPVTEVTAGGIAAVAKLSATRTGDALAPKGTPVRVVQPEIAIPQYSVAIVPRTQADDDKLSNALLRLLAEDPALRVEHPEETQQTVIRGTGDTHVTVAIERLARKFGVDVDVAPVRIAYRETIASAADVEGKVKKQSGGHGQFAVVNLRVSPLERGDGLRFTDAVVGGAIPRTYISSVQAGVEEAMRKGGIHGFPVVDLHVECYDGKYHSVDSSDMAFKTAAAQGLKDALVSAGVTVLEPVSLLTVTVPSAQQGEVMGDITTRRGRVHGSSGNGDGEHVIQAMVPSAELVRYAIDLRSMTGGRGSFTVQHDHYDVLPPHLVDAAKATLPRSR